MNKDFILPLFLLLALSLGCSKISELTEGTGRTRNTSNENSEPPKPGDDAPASGEFAPSSDPKVDIEKMADRFMSLKSFRAEMDGDGQTPMKTDLEFVTPDRYRIKTGNTMEMIVIGKTSYMKMGSKWQKMSLPLDSTISDMRSAFNKEGMKWFSDVKYTGDDTVDGKPAYVYTYHNKGPGAGVGENDSKVWIAKGDGLPIKIEAIYKTGNLKSMKIEYDYETPVVIEPPVN